MIKVVAQMIARPQGASAKEVFAELCVKFPDRPEKGLKITAGAHVHQWPKKHGIEVTKTKDPERGGTVYQISAADLEKHSK